MLQNAGFGTIPCGGGGVVANREPGTYICDIFHSKKQIESFLPFVFKNSVASLVRNIWNLSDGKFSNTL